MKSQLLASQSGQHFLAHSVLRVVVVPDSRLKSEAINLAMIAELPLVVCNIQRAGPSTGMPTKTEQSDLLQMFYGRNGESPIPIIAPSRPFDCFETVYEACRIAVKYRTPVIFLSDLYIGMGAEPWRIPKLSELPEIKADFAGREHAHRKRI